MAMAIGSWEILDAEAAEAGYDLLALPPVRVANIIWSRQRKNMDDETWRKWLTQVTRPLPGQKPSMRLREFRRRVLS